MGPQTEGLAISLGGGLLWPGAFGFVFAVVLILLIRRRAPTPEKVANKSKGGERVAVHGIENHAARSIPAVKSNLYASVEDVPAYEFKTPLQQAIQILKRHRDVMFRTSPTVAPISMIITNLAAHAYTGESDLYTALTHIVEKMPHFMRSERPRIPNPANPAEDYADKWSLDSKLERYFWQWHTQVRAYLKRLPTFVTGETLSEDVQRAFGVVLGEEELRPFAVERVRRAPAIVRVPAVVIPASTPRPWGHGDRKRF